MFGVILSEHLQSKTNPNQAQTWSADARQPTVLDIQSFVNNDGTKSSYDQNGFQAFFNEDRRQSCWECVAKRT